MSGYRSNILNEDGKLTLFKELTIVDDTITINDSTGNREITVNNLLNSNNS